MKVLSGPVLERNPSVANILAVSFGGFALGIMIALLWIVSKEDKRKKEIFSRGSNASISPVMKQDIEEVFAPQDNMEGNFMSDEEYLEKIREMGRQ